MHVYSHLLFFGKEDIMGKKANFKREYNQLLDARTHFGESKHAAKQKMLKQAKENNTPYAPVKGIYSKTTLRTYQKACEQFSSFLRTKHPEIKRFSQGKPYIEEWLESLKDTHSAWTLATYASGVVCAYNIEKKAIDFDFPKRSRANIKRSRGETAYRNSDPKYDDVITFCQATGARRCGVLRVTKNDLRQKEDGTYEIFLKEKNGMSGFRQIIPEFQDEVIRILNESPGYETPNGEMRVFRKNLLPTELHSNRAFYATELYRYYEEQKIYATGEKYYCRGDMKGIVFDKGILQEVSNQLFHHRLDVVVTNYLYNYKQ